MFSKMVDFKHDVFVSSALESDTVTFSLWSLQTGTLLKNYKGVQGCYCLAPAGTDHVLTTQENKQVLFVWDWKKVLLFYYSIHSYLSITSV